MPVEPDDPDYFRQYYAPTHMNLGSYFVGIFAGLWYRDIKATKVDYRRRFVSVANLISLMNFYPAY